MQVCVQLQEEIVESVVMGNRGITCSVIAIQSIVTAKFALELFSNEQKRHSGFSRTNHLDSVENDKSFLNIYIDI